MREDHLMAISIHQVAYTNVFKQHFQTKKETATRYDRKSNSERILAKRKSEKKGYIKFLKHNP